MPGKSHRRLRIASQAEILRAHQRDDEFIDQLREKIVNLCHGRFSGNPFYRSLLRGLQSEIPAKLIYFFITSGLGNQTLGEEYTGIVQANLQNRRVPTFGARLLAALLEYFGEQGLVKLLERLRSKINSPSSKLRPEAIVVLDQLLTRLKNAIPVLVLIHKGMFYMFGRYYSLSKRIAGVDYAKIHGKRPLDGVSWGLRLLGVATLVQCGLRLWQSRKIVEKSPVPGPIGENDSANCQLCLDNSPTTTTPCGHLFCWDCLGDWLRSRSQCPLCRERVTSSRIIYLMNL